MDRYGALNPPLGARVRPLARAGHLQPTVAVTTIATALALSAGQGMSSLWVASAVLTGQLSVGWSNDYLDRHRDRRAGRVDKPIVAGELSAATVARAAMIALALCVPLSMVSGWAAGSVHLLAVAAALAYNARLKSTVFSAVPYAVAFGALPAFVTLGLSGSPAPPAWAVAAGALLGVGAHFVNTLADREEDAENQVRGLPQRFSPSVSLLIGVGAMSAASLLTALAPAGSPGALGSMFVVAALIASAAVVVAVVLDRPRLAWSFTMVVALLTVSGVIASGSAPMGV